jgi:2-iminobutanoate/2-iminopropanoate deaminase
MQDRELVIAGGAPDAIGPYTHAVRCGSVLYCSGALPIEPKSGELRDASPAEATEQCLRNLSAVCEAGGTGLSRALRLTVYTTEIDGFGEINEAYARFFPSDPPARVVVGVASLPKGAPVAIDAIVASP